MYHYAQIGWYSQIDGGFTVWSGDFDVQIDIESSASGLRLENRDLLSGLYKTILEAATLSRFCETNATLLLYQRQIGLLSIETRQPRMLLDAEGTHVTNWTGLEVSPQSNAVTYPSGKFVDPQEPDFSVSYTYSGARINSRGIFLVVIEALAIAARSSPLTPVARLHVMSPSGECVLTLVKVEDRAKVNYSYITKALRILVKDIMVKLKKFEEIAIQLRWQDFLIAEGSIKLKDPGTTEQ